MGYKGFYRWHNQGIDTYMTIIEELTWGFGYETDNTPASIMSSVLFYTLLTNSTDSDEYIRRL